MALCLFRSLSARFVGSHDSQLTCVSFVAARILYFGWIERRCTCIGWRRQRAHAHTHNVSKLHTQIYHLPINIISDGHSKKRRKKNTAIDEDEQNWNAKEMNPYAQAAPKWIAPNKTQHESIGVLCDGVNAVVCCIASVFYLIVVRFLGTTIVVVECICWFAIYRLYVSTAITMRCHCESIHAARRSPNIYYVLYLQ